MNKRKQEAKHLLMLLLLGMMCVTGILWFVLQPFPSLQIKVVFTLFGTSFLAVAFLSVKMGFTPSKFGVVGKRGNTAHFWMQVAWQIVTGFLLILFGWTL